MDKNYTTYTPSNDPEVEYIGCVDIETLCDHKMNTILHSPDPYK